MLCMTTLEASRNAFSVDSFSADRGLSSSRLAVLAPASALALTPSCDVISGSAPCSSSSLVRLGESKERAVCSAVLPSPSSELTSAPFSNSI